MAAAVRTGLDRWVLDGFSSLQGLRVGVVCNQASVSSRFIHILDEMLRAGVQVVAAFGPQHGIWGHTQDNMIEWQGYRDARTGLPFHSLYGEHRKPTAEMLEGLDILVIDLQDVGTRYYTFMWTMALCLEACEPIGLKVAVLDRPNPIGPSVEGGVLDPEYASFVGLHPLPARHGLTMAELAVLFQRRHYRAVQLEAVRMEGYVHGLPFSATGAPWALPSPNMPTVDTALVYPGACLLEATNLSEGRGTTRPFEIFGAPWLDPWRFCEELNRLRVPGAWFRPVVFEPTFQKHAAKPCGGAFLHVTDRERFHAMHAGLAILRTALRQAPGEFAWSPPPYEYEYEKLPIEILAGNGWLHRELERDTPLTQIVERLDAEAEEFQPELEASRLYGGRSRRSAGS
ncbi:MAG: DUF1343 domain-containing protein [Fimbriimonadales bacterium]|nr:DUF1343 domain-containing protein [Fimbriimonadales bacterium]